MGLIKMKKFTYWFLQFMTLEICFIANNAIDKQFQGNPLIQFVYTTILYLGTIQIMTFLFFYKTATKVEK